MAEGTEAWTTAICHDVVRLVRDDVYVDEAIHQVAIDRQVSVEDVALAMFGSERAADRPVDWIIVFPEDGEAEMLMPSGQGRAHRAKRRGAGGGEPIR